MSIANTDVHVKKMSLWDRCITRTLPNVMFPTLHNNNVRIIQSPGYVAITHEMAHDTRIVPLDGRAALSPKIRQYMGESRGHWEGNTLVVDVTNFTDHTNYRARQRGNSDRQGGVQQIVVVSCLSTSPRDAPVSRMPRGQDHHEAYTHGATERRRMELA